MSTLQQRATALADLVAFRRPLSELAERVAQFPFHCDEELVCVTMLDVLAVLRRYLAGELTATDLEAWAVAVEMRDDLGYAPEVVDVLFHLSTPEINRAITPALAQELIERYDSAV
jgi:hypothetical protein